MTLREAYRILNVDSSASDDEVKQSYRKLAKKYHPDRYSGSPLASSASEKMKEINLAYDTIMSDRRSDPDSGSYSDSYAYHDNSYSYSGSFDPAYSEARRLFNEGRAEEAERILDKIPPSERRAEWFYLKGVCVYHKGWLEEACNYVETATRLDPENVEYKSFYQRVQQQRSGESGGYKVDSSPGCGCMDMLACFFCTECCCDCADCLGG